MAALSQLLARGGREETQSQLEEEEEELNRNTIGESCCFFTCGEATQVNQKEMYEGQSGEE